MTLTETRVDEIKTAALEHVYMAMQSFISPDVAGLQERAAEAAGKARGTNELAYVKISIKSEDETAFRVIIDLTSAENDAFYIAYKVRPRRSDFIAVFDGSGDVTDKRGSA